MRRFRPFSPVAEGGGGAGSPAGAFDPEDPRPAAARVRALPDHRIRVERHQLRDDRHVAHERLRARGEHGLVVPEGAPVAPDQPLAHRLDALVEPRPRIARPAGALQDRVDRAPHHRPGRRRVVP